MACAAAAALASGCATAQPGTWRADGSTAPESFDPPPPTASHKWHYHSSNTSAEGLVLCLGSAAIMGGAAAIIYLKRFKGRGGIMGGGGELPEPDALDASLLEAPPAEAAPADEALPPVPAAALP